MIGRFHQWQRMTKLACCLTVIMMTATDVPEAESGTPETVTTIHARQYAFVPSQITVHVGQPVKLVFISDDVPHAISVDGLAIELPITRTPQAIVVTPSKVAELTGRCSRYCGPGHVDMVLTVHVVN